MNPREGIGPWLVAAAALAAAFSFHVADHPGELHDPAHAAAYDAVRTQLPILDAVRVRADDPVAAHILATATEPGVGTVLEPGRSATVFRYGRLLYASPAEIDAVLDALERGEPPAALPPSPDVRRLFRDRNGPYACDVLVEGAADLVRIRELLPNAVLEGEPVRRERETEEGRDLPRALIVVLALVCGGAASLGGARDALRRLLAALLPLAALGLVGWGVDAWTVLALAVVCGAPRGPPLLCAVPCLFFPALTLRRIGIVFLLGAFARWRRDGTPGPGSRKAALAFGLCVLAAGGFALRASFREPVGLEPAARLVAPENAKKTAAALRAAGLRSVVGDVDPVPPEPDLPTRRKLAAIYQLADVLARSAPEAERARFREVADAAALDELYLPRPLRERLRARDGRHALWIQEEAALGRKEFTSSELYRLRGDRGLRRDARLAAWLALLLGGGALCLVRPRAVVLRFLAIAAAASLGLLAGFAGLTAGVDPALPLLVAAALGPSWWIVLGLAGAVAGLAGSLAVPAAAVAVAVVLALVQGWLSRRPR